MFEFDGEYVINSDTGKKYDLLNQQDMIRFVSLINSKEVIRNSHVESLEKFITDQISNVEQLKTKSDNKGENTSFYAGFIHAMRTVKDLAFEGGIYNIK